MSEDVVTLSSDKFGQLMISAIRYALGRRSYIVGATVDLAIEHLAALDANAREVIERDIRECRDYGEAMDKREWMRLLSALVLSHPSRGAGEAGR